jgi:hypothetical protein
MDRPLDSITLWFVQVCKCSFHLVKFEKSFCPIDKINIVSKTKTLNLKLYFIIPSNFWIWASQINLGTHVKDAKAWWMSHWTVFWWNLVHYPPCYLNLQYNRNTLPVKKCMRSCSHLDICYVSGLSIALNLIHPVFFPLIWAHLKFAHYTPQVTHVDVPSKNVFP